MHKRVAYLSASSSTSTPSSFVLTTVLPLPIRNSSIRPGVPITISAPVSRNRCISCAVEDWSDEMRRRGGGKSVCWMSSPSVDGELGCEDKNNEKTEWIWVASSLYRACRWVQDNPFIIVPCWANNQSTHFVSPQPTLPPDQTFKYWDNKGQRFPGASNSFDDDVFVLHKERNCGRLHGGHLGVSHCVDHIETRKDENRLQAHVDLHTSMGWVVWEETSIVQQKHSTATSLHSYSFNFQ